MSRIERGRYVLENWEENQNEAKEILQYFLNYAENVQSVVTSLQDKFKNSMKKMDEDNKEYEKKKVEMFEEMKKQKEESRQRLDKLVEESNKRRQQFLDEIQKEEDEEKLLVAKIKDKLKDISFEDLYNKTWPMLRKANFKNLSFLSDIMEDWDLTHLTGNLAIIANAGLSLNRETDEIDFYMELFKQLDKDKLVEFLAWSVAGEELSEDVVDDILN